MIFNNKKGFTLIEILIVIVLIAIMTIGVSGLFVRNNGNFQKLQIEANKLVTILDTVKNNELVGKAVKIETTTTPKKTRYVNPESYTITFSGHDNKLTGDILENSKVETTATGIFKIGSETGYIIDTELKNLYLDKYDIRRITCFPLSNSGYIRGNNNTNLAGLNDAQKMVNYYDIPEGKLLKLTYGDGNIITDCNSTNTGSYKKIEIIVGLKNNVARIRMNTISGVMEQVRYFFPDDPCLTKDTYDPNC